MMHVSWDIEHDIQNVLSFCNIFLPFYPASPPSPSPLTTQKINILKKWKKPGDIVILHMCTINDNYIMYDSWDIEHEDRIFYHFKSFLPFYPNNNPKKSRFWKNKSSWRYHFTKVYSKSWSYAILFLRYGVQCNFYFSFWAIFCPFIPITAQKSKTLKNEKKMLGDIIILHMFTKNHDHMMYNSWDMVHKEQTDRQKKWHWVPNLKKQCDQKTVINDNR